MLSGMVIPGPTDQHHKISGNGPVKSSMISLKSSSYSTTGYEVATTTTLEHAIQARIQPHENGGAAGDFDRLTLLSV